MAIQTEIYRNMQKSPSQINDCPLTFLRFIENMISSMEGPVQSGFRIHIHGVLKMVLKLCWLSLDVIFIIPLGFQQPPNWNNYSHWYARIALQSRKVYSKLILLRTIIWMEQIRTGSSPKFQEVFFSKLKFLLSNKNEIRFHTSRIPTKKNNQQPYYTMSFVTFI